VDCGGGVRKVIILSNPTAVKVNWSFIEVLVEVLAIQISS